LITVQLTVGGDLSQHITHNSIKQWRQQLHVHLADILQITWEHFNSYSYK